MGEFFKEWRRKVGCVTLMIASVSMAGWIRSFLTDDFVAFPFEIEISNWSLAGLAAESQSVILYAYSMEPVQEQDPVESFLATSGTTIPDVEAATPADALSASVESVSLPDQWTVTGEGASRSHTTTISCSLPEPVPLVIIPFWWFVVPLTLFSAYLILWPGQQTTSGMEHVCHPPV